MTPTEMALALTTLLTGLSAVYASWRKSRSDTRVNEAKAEADVAQQQAQQNLADRNQIMSEYGKLIGEMRGEIITSKEELRRLWNELYAKMAEHERCNQRLTILETWARKHGWVNGEATA